MSGSTPPPIAHRRRIIEQCHRRIATATYIIRKRYRTSLDDYELSLDDLTQFGSIKALELYDSLHAADAQSVLGAPEADLKRRLIKFGLHCIACHIIDVYRRRDGRREAIAPAALLTEVDETDVRRMELWRRLTPVLAEISPRQRRVVEGMWRGLQADAIAEETGWSANIVYKDMARVRETAARIAA